MKLAIISHTAHYADENGIIKGWGPTIREINYLAPKFDEIIHLAFLHTGKTPASSLPYTASNIRFVALPPSGGKGFGDKLSVATSIPEIIRQTKMIMPEVGAIQIRVPTGIANFLLPWLSFRKVRPIIWVKYAGNWKQSNAPAGYRFQRWWLQQNFLKSKVTINGKWNDQPGHCITFENPCLDEDERTTGKKVIESKTYSGPYTAVFIGRLEEEKGVKRILDALQAFHKKNITTIHFIGDGKDLNLFRSIAASQNLVKCVFHGSVSRNEVSDYLAQSHFLLLPSTASEGFPKVIAEGGNYGAIPLVSAISSISQYINDTNGFVWDFQSSFTEYIDSLEINEMDLKTKSQRIFEVSGAFTFSNYYRNLKQHILNDH